MSGQEAICCGELSACGALADVTEALAPAATSRHEAEVCALAAASRREAGACVRAVTLWREAEAYSLVATLWREAEARMLTAASRRASDKAGEKGRRAFLRRGDGTRGSAGAISYAPAARRRPGRGTRRRRRKGNQPVRRYVLAREERAQATVEMAVVTPVLLVLALIVYNLMVFLSATARFDRIAPDTVIAQGVSPAGESGASGKVSDASADIEKAIKKAMGNYDVEVEVSCTAGGGVQEGERGLALVGALRTYRCEFRMKPWPSGLTIAGVSMGAPAFLRHERSVTIDPWRPGVVV